MKTNLPEQACDQSQCRDKHWLAHYSGNQWQFVLRTVIL